MSDVEKKIGALVSLVENKTKTYVLSIPCFNCGVTNVHTIPFGTTVSEFNPQCPKCGVRQKQLDFNGPVR